MSYIYEERLDIYHNLISKYDAAVEYGVMESTIRDYMRLYRAANKLPPKKRSRSVGDDVTQVVSAYTDETSKYANMTKDELILEIVDLKVEGGRLRNCKLFRSYHEKFPSHGYRWLNAKIKLGGGPSVSDLYAHECCRMMGIKSQSKHYRYKKLGEPRKVFPNLLLAGINTDKPLQCIYGIC